MTATASLSAIQPAPNPAGPGNQRATRHATGSETAIAPVRQQKAQALAARYPDLDPDLIAVQAHRLAQIELAAAYLDEKGGIVRDHRMGRVYDVADKLMTWSRTAERWIEAREAELCERTKGPDAARRAIAEAVQEEISRAEAVQDAEEVDSRDEDGGV